MENLPTIEPTVILYHGQLHHCERVWPPNLLLNRSHVFATNGHYYHNLTPLPPEKVPAFCQNINWDPNIPLPIIHAIGD